MNQYVMQSYDLVRTFGKTRAVDGLTLEVSAGEVFGFLGHNGAGKTTTVRLFNGVLTPTSGEMRVLGYDPVQQGPQVRARTGVLTESPALDDRLTARMTLRIFGEIFGMDAPQRNRRTDELLEMFDLSSRADDKVGGFSKGMRQRMALARTIVHSPDIIFLDEPTAALDPVATREVHTMIRDASQKEGRTVFLCTHNLYEAERLCTRVAVLAQGKVLAMGTPSDLAAKFGKTQRILVEVAPAQALQATACIEDLPVAPVVEQDITAQGILRVQGIPHADAPRLVAALVAAGIAIYQVVPEQATLEDVYFALQDAQHTDHTGDVAHA